MKIEIDRESKVAAYQQIYRQVRDQIEDGTIEKGTRLPAIRELASSLGVARNTVEAACRQLSLEGYVTGKRGFGYTVEDLDFSLLGDDYQNVSEDFSDDTVIAGPDPFGTNRCPLGDTFGCTYDFSYGNRSPSSLPVSIWRALANKAFRDESIRAAGSYIDPLGLPGLRLRIARYLASTRGVRCSPDQIVMQPGTQYAIHALSDLLEEENPRIAMEDPGYNGARIAFLHRRCDIVPIPAYNGLESFLSFLVASKAHMAFLTPANQFPLGYTLPMAARLQVIGWARRTGAYIVEDDYCCEYRYDADNIPSLQSLSPERVIYLGTLSKILTPAVRMSYLVLPPALLSRWKTLNHSLFCPVAWLDQEMQRLFMSSSDWNRYVHTTVNLYRKRHDLLVDSIKSCMGEHVDIVGANVGLHVLVGDKGHRNSSELIELARRNDVRVYSINEHWANKSHPMNNYVMLGFSSIEDELIPEGIRRLAHAWYG